MFEWRCQEKGYDVLENGYFADKRISRSTAVPLKTSHGYGFFRHWMGCDELWIIGRRNGVPSNMAAIQVTSCAQEEFFSIPFTNGVAPNWTSWTYGNTETKVIFEEGRREANRPYPDDQITIYGPADKMYYQVLKSEGDTSVGGIYRHFFTLIPKHRYRLNIRLNVQGTSPSTTIGTADECSWSFSVHAVANRSGEHENLTPEQMTGLSPLPDGTAGIDAGQIVGFGPEATTSGQWIQYATGKTRPGGIVGDITLPENCDTITVWLRVSGNVLNGAAMDWIKLEDLTAEAVSPDKLVFPVAADGGVISVTNGIKGYTYSTLIEKTCPTGPYIRLPGKMWGENRLVYVTDARVYNDHLILVAREGHNSVFIEIMRTSDLSSVSSVATGGFSQATISPSGRWVVYTDTDDKISEGWIFYAVKIVDVSQPAPQPQKLLTAPDTPGSPGSGLYHNLTSPFLWSEDEGSFIFLARRRIDDVTENYLVVIDLSGDPVHVTERIVPIDLLQYVDLAQEDSYSSPLDWAVARRLQWKDADTVEVTLDNSSADWVNPVFTFDIP